MIKGLSDIRMLAKPKYGRLYNQRTAFREEDKKNNST